jgi:hypothetical protein
VRADRRDPLRARLSRSGGAPAGAASAAATWDRQAARYGAQERFERRSIEAALALAAPLPEERLVDLATGTGLLLRRLAGSPSRPHEAIGVDRSARMLARVGALPRGWSTALAPADAVAVVDGWADVVTCAYLLQLLAPAQRHAVLREARRLLRSAPSSRLVVVTPWVDARRPAGRVLRAALRLLARTRPTAWGGLNPLDPSRDLVAAGFVVTRRIVRTRGGYPSLVLAARPGSTRPRPG